MISYFFFICQSIFIQKSLQIKWHLSPHQNNEKNHQTINGKVVREEIKYKNNIILDIPNPNDKMLKKFKALDSDIYLTAKKIVI